MALCSEGWTVAPVAATILHGERRQMSEPIGRVDVTRGDLQDPAVIALLDEHLVEMRIVTPDPESVPR